MMRRGGGRPGVPLPPDHPRHRLSRADARVFRRLLAFTRPYIRRMILATVCLLVASLLNLVFPWIVRSLVDSVFVHHDEHALNLITLGLFAVFIFQAGFNFSQNYLIGWVGERIIADLRRTIFTHLQSLSQEFYGEHRTGDLMSRVTNDVNAVQNVVSGNLLSLLQQLVTLLGSLVIIFYLDWRLSLLMLVVTPLIAGSAAIFGRLLTRIARRVQEELGNATTVLEETLSNVRVVQAFTREPHEIERYGGLVERVFSLTLGRLRLRASFVSLITFLTFGAITIVLWFGGREVLAGHLSPGGLISFLFYIFLIAGPLGTLTNLYGQTQEAMGAAGRIFEVLDTSPGIADTADAHPLPPLRECPEFDQVRFSYIPEREVLRGVSLRVEAGKMVALVGPSGAGKTTIASLIPRFHEPDSGAILIDGTDIRQATLASLRGQIALVPQEPVLFGLSVRENIAYGRLEASEPEIIAAAQAANAHQFIMELPEGYDSLVGERGVKLSGGQRQRVAIARAILRDPRILILDEATSSLDNESERLVQEALEHLMAGRTTLVIAHRLTTIQQADQIVVLDAGIVVETGTHQSLLAAEGLYHRLYTVARRQGDLLPEAIEASIF
ncbi:MAG TPA: ABC transporter transmembrane domain-containing protein [Chloroflexota bacterium]|nr:ABC transporter transmembrane domain-containing protein [Chloroflexota bacterium]